MSIISLAEPVCGCCAVGQGACAQFILTWIRSAAAPNMAHDQAQQVPVRMAWPPTYSVLVVAWHMLCMLCSTVGACVLCVRVNTRLRKCEFLTRSAHHTCAACACRSW